MGNMTGIGTRTRSTQSTLGGQLQMPSGGLTYIGIGVVGIIVIVAIFKFRRRRKKK
jgi:subtilase family serine protease